MRTFLLASAIAFVAACTSPRPPTSPRVTTCDSLASDAEPISLAEARDAGFPTDGRLVVEASVTYLSSCPTCPEGAKCTPCPPADIALHDPAGGRGIRAYAGTPLPEHEPLVLELVENPLDRPTVVACRPVGSVATH